MGNIIVAGSINMDVVAQVAHHPRPGETVFGSNLQFIPGGKGSNQAVAAARLGGDVSLLGKLGRDAFGSTLMDFLEGESLNLAGVRRSDETASGTALIAVNEDSENTIIVIPGSNAELAPEETDSVELNEADVVLAVFEIQQATIRHLFRRAKASGATTVLNPAPAAAFIDGLQETVDYLVVNETELAFFAGTQTVSDDEDFIREQAYRLRTSAEQAIVVTLGAKGVVCVQADSMIRVPGRRVNAVDTTAAGDCFVGALAVALNEQQETHRALEFASAAASISVQTAGASSSLPYRAAVDAVL